VHAIVVVDDEEDVEDELLEVDIEDDTDVEDDTAPLSEAPLFLTFIVPNFW
jgi:hypothetical protein